MNRRNVRAAALATAVIGGAGAVYATSDNSPSLYRGGAPVDTPKTFIAKKGETVEVPYSVQASPDLLDPTSNKPLQAARHLLQVRMARDGSAATFRVLAPMKNHLPDIDNPPYLVTPDRGNYLVTSNPGAISLLAGMALNFCKQLSLWASRVNVNFSP